ncbi:MAG: hypothetical protein LBS49_02755 [Candidatus Accumulibacter sp.]|jgi:hypothetical protein|nr:hypothetical protein [Accumulibacter sp.]
MFAERNPRVAKAEEKVEAGPNSWEALRRDLCARVRAAENQARKREKFLLACQLLDLDQPVEVIVQATGLPREVIESLTH